MAIAADATADGGVQTASFTFSITISSASGRLLVVGTFGSNTNTNDISGVTANGRSLTLVDTQSDNATFIGGGSRVAALWKLANADAGSNTISVTYTGSNACCAVAASYTGVDDTHESNKGTGTLTPNNIVVTDLTISTVPAWMVGVMRDTVGSESISSSTSGTAVIRISSTGHGLIIYDTNANVSPSTGSQQISIDPGSFPAASGWINVAIGQASSATWPGYQSPFGFF